MGPTERQLSTEHPKCVPRRTTTPRSIVDDRLSALLSAASKMLNPKSYPDNPSHQLAAPHSLNPDQEICVSTWSWLRQLLLNPIARTMAAARNYCRTNPHAPCLSTTNSRMSYPVRVTPVSNVERSRHPQTKQVQGAHTRGGQKSRNTTLATTQPTP